MLKIMKRRLLALTAMTIVAGFMFVACKDDPEPEVVVAITADGNIPTYSKLNGYMNTNVNTVVSKLEGDSYEVMNRVNDPVGTTARVEMRKKGAGDVNYYYVLTYDKSTKLMSGAEFEYNIASVAYADMKSGILKVLADDTLFCADQPMEFYSATLRCEKKDTLLCDLLTADIDSTILIWQSQPRGTVVRLATAATAMQLTTANHAVYNSGSLYFTKQLLLR